MMMSADLSEEDQHMRDQEETHLQNQSIHDTIVYDDSQMICPIMINPNNPIKDPSKYCYIFSNIIIVTKKRIR